MKPIKPYLLSLMQCASLPNMVRLGAEDRICIEFATRLRHLALEGRLKCTFTHLANEGKRSLIVARILRALGMITGAPDYVICWENGSGFIEMKAGKGVQTPAQKWFEAWCSDNKVAYRLCYSADEAIAEMEDWGVII